MTEQDLIKGKELPKLIKTTEEALTELDKWIVTLDRKFGNTLILQRVKAELEGQLTQFKEQFASL